MFARTPFFRLSLCVPLLLSLPLTPACSCAFPTSHTRSHVRACTSTRARALTHHARMHTHTPTHQRTTARAARARSRSTRTTTAAPSGRRTPSAPMGACPAAAAATAVVAAEGGASARGAAATSSRRRARAACCACPGGRRLHADVRRRAVPVRASHSFDELQSIDVSTPARILKDVFCTWSLGSFRTASSRRSKTDSEKGRAC